MTKQKAPKLFVQKHRVLVGFFAILLIILSLAAGRFIYEQSVVNEMRTIADNFAINSKLTNQRDYIVRPNLLCIGDEPCPMYDRSWAVVSPLNLDEFKQMIPSADNNIGVNGDCRIPNNASGSVSLCNASYLKNGYRVDFIYEAYTSDRTKDYVLIRITKDD